MNQFSCKSYNLYTSATKRRRRSSNARSRVDNFWTKFQLTCSVSVWHVGFQFFDDPPLDSVTGMDRCRGGICHLGGSTLQSFQCPYRSWMKNLSLTSNARCCSIQQQGKITRITINYIQAHSLIMVNQYLNAGDTLLIRSLLVSH